ncbi:flavin reductase [Pigmentiphaga sp. H8]|uniref:flavin reductase family protein n=1 Tax=Pigmentiphaga sp. H8 TaxID=2488560 RepID=UPI000F5B4FE5|nr:flavin reductase family protein [Pigmentiphaga sp. H8]AZG08502.1 flavin reductase [Pigmentiphaga sp. H8]
MALSAEEFRRMMRRYPAAVTVITTGQAPDRAGMTATAVMSLSMEPVQLVCAINRSTYTHERLVRHGRFCVNVLERGQIQVAKRFAGQGGMAGEARFGADDWTSAPSGVPMLKGAVLAFDCALVRSMEAGTHTLIVGEVEAGCRSGELQPLLYVDGGWAGIEPVAELG